MIRQGEFGVSGAFDQQGRVLAAHDYGGTDQHVVYSDVPMSGAPTVYRAIGDVFAWLCLAGTVVAIGLAVRDRRSRRSS
jgi:apolipoprotein N-acyltransferase